jgi:hypothetical protein
VAGACISSPAHSVTSENKPEQCRRGAQDGQVRPLPLGLDAEMPADFLERRLGAPTRNETGRDVRRLIGEVGAEEGLRLALAGGITDQHPADRRRRQAGMLPDRGAGDDFDALSLGRGLPFNCRRPRRPGLYQPA